MQKGTLPAITIRFIGHTESDSIIYKSDQIYDNN